MKTRLSFLFVAALATQGTPTVFAQPLPDCTCLVTSPPACRLCPPGTHYVDLGCDVAGNATACRSTCYEKYQGLYAGSQSGGTCLAGRDYAGKPLIEGDIVLSTDGCLKIATATASGVRLLPLTNKDGSAACFAK